MQKGPILGVLALLGALGAVMWGVSTRTRALAVVTQETRDMAVPAVAVVTATRGAPQEEIVLPGTIQAFADAPIYARTNGYLKRWHVDIGARVQAGAVLGRDRTPEVRPQPVQGRAALATNPAHTP